MSFQDFLEVEDLDFCYGLYFQLVFCLFIVCKGVDGEDIIIFFMEVGERRDIVLFQFILNFLLFVMLKFFYICRC